MFDIGFSELALVAVVALLVLGPERLPRVARTAGALLRRVRGSWQEVRGQIERELEAEDLKRALDEMQRATRAGRAAVQREVESLIDPGHVPPASAPAAEPASPALPESGEDAAAEAPGAPPIDEGHAGER